MPRRCGAGANAANRERTGFTLGEEVFGKVTSVLDEAIMVDLANPQQTSDEFVKALGNDRAQLRLRELSSDGEELNLGLVPASERLVNVAVDTDLQFAFEEDFTDHAKLVPAQEKLASGSTFVWVDGAHVTPEPEDLSFLAGAKAISFSGCSNSRQTSTTSGWNSAKTYATNAKNYLNAGTHGARYTTWFGTYTSSRFNTVKNHFTAISDAVNNKPLVFDCSCTDSAYAYVYPTQPYRIYLCNAFWSAPTTGTDSKAGTIIHETSHFNAVAGTDDWAYGQSAAKSLARSNPTRAVDNADSHEYFAENTPSQN